MKPTVAILLLTGYALLTVARIPVFASDRALWLDALPSTAPRVHVNAAAALLQAGEYERAVVEAERAVELAERPASDYERVAVRALVTNQIQWIDSFYPICTRPSLQPFC